MPKALTKEHKPLGHKSRAILDAMVFKGLTPAQAAADTGITRQTAYLALADPRGRRYYENQLQVLRSGERGRNIRIACDLREDRTNGARARVDAMRYIDGIDYRGHGAGLNINVGVGVSVQPGYIVDIGQHRSEAADILQLSGSVKNVLDDQ